MTTCLRLISWSPDLVMVVVNGVCIDWSVHLEDWNNVKTINRTLHQLIDAKGKYLENYRYVDECETSYTSAKAVYAMHVSLYPNLSTDEKISLWGNRMVLSSDIYHEGEQSHCRYYTLGVNVDNTWFLISDTRILQQQKMKGGSRNTYVPYI